MINIFTFLQKVLPFLLLLTTSGSFAQYTLTTGNSADSLASKLKGEGINILNSTLYCRDAEYGNFHASFSGAGALGIDEGIILSLHKVEPIFNTFDSVFNYTWHSLSPFGYNSIDTNYLRPFITAWQPEASIYYTTRNTCALSIDFIPDNPALTVDYVFATNSNMHFGTNSTDCRCFPYTDFAGIFLSGGDRSDTINLAELPEGNHFPVSNYTLHNYDTAFDIRCHNIAGEYYFQGSRDENIDIIIDNQGGSYMSNFGYATFTQSLQANAELKPCDTYSLTFVISKTNGLPWDATCSAVAMPGKSSIFLNNLRTSGTYIDCVNAIESVNAKELGIILSPNPFQSHIKITDKMTHPTKQWQLQLSDVLGRSLGNAKGTIPQIQQYLDQLTPNLADNLYFLHLQNDKGQSHVFKIVKQQ